MTCQSIIFKRKGYCIYTLYPATVVKLKAKLQLLLPINSSTERGKHKSLAQLIIQSKCEDSTRNSTWRSSTSINGKNQDKERKKKHIFTT